MNRVPSPSPALAAGLLLAVAAGAQTPVDPPPWWRVADNQTVSLYWSFDPPFPAGQPPQAPTAAVVPPWYNAAITGWNASTNLVYLPTLSGHVGVLALQGTGAPVSAALRLTVDNDPYPDWIKIFWFQFDAFEGASGSLSAAIAQSLGYDRANVSERSVPIGNGWQRVTIRAQLIPQPDDEAVDWSFVESAAGTVAIDNLFVSSKCVKPGPDETGDALGDVAQLVDLTAATAGGDCRGVAVTEGPGPAFVKSYWVSVRTPATIGGPHRLLRLGPTAPFPVVANVPLAATALTAPQGPGDVAVETTTSTGTVIQQRVWVILDERPAGPVQLQGFDAATGTTTLLPLAFPPLAIVPANQVHGLAFDPSGELGAGTFWVSSTDQSGQGAMREFSRDPQTPGALLDTRPFAPSCPGLGYDDALGNFYGFSRDVQPSPAGPVEATGFELSGYDFARTGVRFCSDLTRPNGPGPRGGSALGFDVYRSRANPTSQLNLVCLVETPNDPTASHWLCELAGPFSFGWSLLGRCGMRDTGPFNGVPFVGGVLQVTLTGVPDTLFATMFLGFDNQSSPLGPLPLSLTPLLGWPESVLSVAPDVNTALLVPTTPGEFVFPVPIPPVPALGYQSVFVQCLALDTGVPGFFAMSQAGKTVLYP